MTEKAKEARRAYKREWAKKNAEKVREYQRNYWERRAEQTEEAEAVKEPDREAFRKMKGASGNGIK